MGLLRFTSPDGHQRTVDTFNAADRRASQPAIHIFEDNEAFRFAYLGLKREQGEEREYRSVNEELASILCAVAGVKIHVTDIARSREYTDY